MVRTTGWPWEVCLNGQRAAARWKVGATTATAGRSPTERRQPSTFATPLGVPLVPLYSSTGPINPPISHEPMISHSWSKITGMYDSCSYDHDNGNNDHETNI